MKYLFGLLMLFATASVSAQVTCKENVMTTDRFCSSKPERAGANYYFFATNDPGTQANVLFSFGDLVSSARPDGVMVKLDDGTPFKVRASSTRPDVNCGRYRNCRWSVGAAAEFTDAQFDQIAAATRMLVSFTQGSYVSEPFEANPRIIAAWFQQWRTMTNGNSLDRDQSGS